MYELIYSPSSLKELEKLDLEMKIRIVNALERLRIKPESCDIKKLVGTDIYRLRVGNYRIIFDIEKDKILIVIIKIGHRKNITKKVAQGFSHK